MRQPIGELIESDLAEADQTEDWRREMPVDRTRALSQASDLGKSIKRLAIGFRGDGRRRDLTHRFRADDVATVVECLDSALCKRSRYWRDYGTGERYGLCAVALREWLLPLCGRCEGKGWIQGMGIDCGRQLNCPKCEGSGKRLWTDGNRGRRFGRRLSQLELELVDDALQLLRDHDALAGSVVARVVGRD